jgi:hypothetical protein
MTGISENPNVSPATAAKTPGKTMISALIYANSRDNQHAATHNCEHEMHGAID